LFALRDFGIPAVVLRSPTSATSGATSWGRNDWHILVRQERVSELVARVERMKWRYAWLRTRRLALLPFDHYWWDGGASLSVHWALPAAPLPARTLDSVASALWRKAVSIGGSWLEPDPSALLVHLAVQACRPTRWRDADLSHFRECLSRVDDLQQAERIARDAGVLRALRRARVGAAGDRNRLPDGDLYDGALRPVWVAANAALRRIRPRARRLLAGAPALGDFGMRCRVLGTEVVAGPDVFIPTPDADHFVRMALDMTAGIAEPTIAEAGTGCGAIALSFATLRPDSHVHAADLSAPAIGSARDNAARIAGQNVRFYRGSLLEPMPQAIKGRTDVVMANLPFYPAEGFAAVGSVPRDTIQGYEEDGLGLVRQVADDAIAFLRPGGYLILQMFAWQWDRLSPYLAARGYEPGEAFLSGQFAICPARRVGE
jgi:release factor glutamine methyltransferase